MGRNTGKIIRGYWDCPYCGRKGIDGLFDKCPGCGTGKPADTRYYMGSHSDQVSEKELEAAGIGRDESDGKHKEWVCAFCGQLNNWRDQACVSCGAPRESSEMEYGDAARRKAEREAKEAQDLGSQAEERKKKKKHPFLFILAAVLLLLILVNAPLLHETETVTGFAWDREVTVEALETVEETGWDLPEGADLIRKQSEIHHYQQVLDHYETRYETRSREVLDGYDTIVTYEDNGNGTFREVEEQTPRYRTEYYEEEVQVPVYRDEPVFRTKYDYYIDRWISKKSYPTSGEDQEPYWSTDYTLKENERDSLRKEFYAVLLKGKKETRLSVDYGTFVKIRLGDRYKTTRSITGTVYRREFPEDLALSEAG